MVKGRDQILVAILMTMVTFQAEIQPVLNKLWADFDAFLRDSSEMMHETIG